jgi:hypothetical protein
LNEEDGIKMDEVGEEEDEDKPKTSIDFRALSGGVILEEVGEEKPFFLVKLVFGIVQNCSMKNKSTDGKSMTRCYWTMGPQIERSDHLLASLNSFEKHLVFILRSIRNIISSTNG